MTSRNYKSFISKNNYSLVDTYRSMNKILFSECKNAPSDSSYYKILMTRELCHKSYALYLSYARVLWEHDLGKISSRQAIPINERLRWIHVPTTCNF